MFLFQGFDHHFSMFVAPLIVLAAIHVYQISAQPQCISIRGIFGICCTDGFLPNGKNQACCETVMYDTETQICCGGVLNLNGLNLTCCGTQSYNPNLNSYCCCNEELIPCGANC